jgi:hypothetical protein
LQNPTAKITGSGRVPALQTRSPEFYKKKKRRKEPAQSVILAAQEAEIRSIAVQSQPG